MDGLWKEKLGGWNHKDTYRKSQTRRNSFRDKAKGIASRHGINWKINAPKTRKHRYAQYDVLYEREWLEGIYGIKFNSHREWITVYPETQYLRKNAQKLATRMDRQKVRDYIAKGDWDTDIKSHALSKSIAWEIH